MNVLSKKNMLVSLHIGQWTASKFDRKVSEDVASQYNMAPNAGRYSKFLLDKESLNKINAIAGKARTLHMHLTLPWDDNGFRILSSEGYFNYTSTMSKLKDEFYSAVEEFIPLYDEHIKAAKLRLGQLFNEEDYPCIDRLREKFYFTLDFMPIADDIKDFRVDLSDEDIQEITHNELMKQEDRVVSAMYDVAERVKLAASNMVSRLRGYGVDDKGKVVGKFHDTLVSNVKDLADLLPTFNLTNDPRIDALQQELMELVKYSAEDLRDDSRVREMQANKAEKVVSEIRKYF